MYSFKNNDTPEQPQYITVIIVTACKYNCSSVFYSVLQNNPSHMPFISETV